MNARFYAQGMPLTDGNLCVSDRRSLFFDVVSVILSYFEYVLNFPVRHVNHTRVFVSFMGTKAIVSLSIFKYGHVGCLFNGTTGSVAIRYKGKLEQPDFGITGRHSFL